MSISSISAYFPQAVNHINDRTIQNSTLSNKTDQKIIKSLFSSDNDYTKKEAILRQRSTHFTINKDGTVTEIPRGKSDPRVGSLEEFEKQLQINGIEKEVNWSDVKFDLWGIGFDANKAAYSLGEDDFTRKTNYLASRYAAVENKILNAAAGSARAEQMEKLNGLYQKALDEIAAGYSGIVGSFLESNGVSGEREKIYDSIVSGMETKIGVYRRGLSGSAALESLKGTPDEWLLDDDAYVASVLRATVSVPKEAVQSKSENVPYTMDDLDALGQYASALSEMDSPNNEVNRTFCTDESRLGVEYAMLDMKTDRLRNSGRVSDAMSELLEKTMNGFMRSYLERLDRELTGKREKGGAPDDAKGYAALDRSAVWDVYHYTMREYKNGADVIQALLSGVKYGSKKTAVLLAKGETYRSRDSAWFWSNFFERDKRRYKSPDSSYQKYVAGWRDFEASLSGGRSVRMNLALKGSEYYAAGKNGVMDRKA